MHLDDRRTALYRLFDAAGALLYVGIAECPETRFDQHRKDKVWWHEVASRTVEWRDTRPGALAAEREAIKGERPRYNRVHHPDYVRIGYFKADDQDEVTEDGVRLVSQPLARKGITEVVRTVADGTVTAVTRRSRPAAYLVPPSVWDELLKLRADAAAN